MNPHLRHGQKRNENDRKKKRTQQTPAKTTATALAEKIAGYCSPAYLLSVDEGNLEPGEQKRDGDARPHGPSADNSHRFHLGRLACCTGNSKRRALGDKEVPSSAGLLRLNHLRHSKGMKCIQHGFVVGACVGFSSSSRMVR